MTLAPATPSDPAIQEAKVSPEADAAALDADGPATWVGSTTCGGSIRLTTQDRVLSGAMQGRRVPFGQLSHMNQGPYVVYFNGGIDSIGTVTASGGAPDGREVSVSGRLPDVTIGGSFYCDGKLRLTRQ